MKIYRPVIFFSAIAMILSVERLWSSVEGSEYYLNSAATMQRVDRIQALAFFAVACLAVTAGLALRKLEKKATALGDTVAALRETVAMLEQQFSSGRVIRQLGDRIAALEEELAERGRE